VFSDEAMAARAYEWAVDRGVRIPKQLAIIGLQNDPAHYHLGISYCGPDWDTIGYLMAHSIMQDFEVEKTSQGFLRTKAHVVERLTT
jgi:DNA-binding LacI/PurR family transcriptional regulator